MTYYQILRQRRLDLKLSIQDVSSQTRLAPQYIHAIEEHNLDVFSDDFSFVRYFVRAYCEAIGVNWEAVKEEVDADIRAYAYQRNMALTQAQRKMVQGMPSGQGRKVRRKSQTNFQKRVNRLSRSLHWSKEKTIRVFVGGIGAVIALLVVVNFGLDYMSEQKSLQEQQARETELAKKEAETEKLANQRKQEQQKEEIVVENTGINEYTVTNVLEQQAVLDIEVTLPLDSTVAIYKDDELIAGSETTEYSGSFQEEITVDGECTLEIVVGTYASNEFRVNGNNLAFDETYWYTGDVAAIDVVVASNTTADDTETDGVVE